MISPRVTSYTFQKATAGVVFGLRLSHAARVVGFWVHVEGGTNAVCNAQVDPVTALTFVDLLTADKTCLADVWTSALSTLHATRKVLPAGTTIKPEIVSVAGAPTNVTVQIDLAYDADSR
jgi:hypothetical protein